MTLPSGKVYSYNYRSAAGLLDSDSSRVTQVKDGETSLVTYDYNGVDQVVGTYYEEPDVMSKQYTTTVGDYADLDRFNRVVTSKWTKYIPSPGTNRDFFNVAVGWDRNSNVTYQDDSVHDAFGAAYTNDDLNRLIVSAEGTGTGGTISTLKRKQEWTLTQTGNWTLDKLDLNGDADWSDTDEWQDGRTHNAVNELTARDLDNNSGTSGNNYSLAYDAAGNLTDDGTDYEYEWDAFYRLRKVKRTDNQALVAEYRYNGLGYRIAEHADTDTDGDVDGSDKWFYFAYDNRWRLVATFRESDSSPKEEFVHQHAGMRGSGSYIDLVAFRDKDANTAWTTASDATLEERLYYCQNWRADVVAIVQCTNPATGAAKQIEQARYSAYGVPFGLPAGDADSDGDVDASDVSTVTGWSGVTYNVLGDVDLDGDVDANDVSAVSGLSGTTLGREVLSSAKNRKGYAGYEGVVGPRGLWHVRARVLNDHLGRWQRRDDNGYTDGASPYAYSLRPLKEVDSSGANCTVPVPSGPQPAWTVGSSSEPGTASTYAWVSEKTKKCCKDAKANGLDLGAGGKVICCHGKKIPCTWIDINDYQNYNPPMDKDAQQMLKLCKREHERTHFDDVEDCPPTGVTRPDWTADKKNPDGTPNAAGQAEEVTGGQKELDCYNKRQKDCKTDACRQWVEGEKNNMRNYIIANGGTPNG